MSAWQYTSSPSSAHWILSRRRQLPEMTIAHMQHDCAMCSMFCPSCKGCSPILHSINQKTAADSDVSTGDVDISACAGGEATDTAVANTTAAGRVPSPPPRAPARKLLQGGLSSSSLGQQPYEALEVKVMAYVTNDSVFESLVGTCAPESCCREAHSLAQLLTRCCSSAAACPVLSVPAAPAGRKATVGTAAGPCAICVDLWVPGACTFVAACTSKH